VKQLTNKIKATNNMATQIKSVATTLSRVACFHKIHSQLFNKDVEGRLPTRVSI